MWDDMMKDDVGAELVGHFPEMYLPDDSDDMMEEEWSSDYEGRCGNCHAYIDDADRFCRICGTRRGEGAFAPYRNVVQCIYGPMPIDRWHKCSGCGYSWKTHSMVDRARFCPKCGAEASCSEIPEEPEVKPTISLYLEGKGQWIEDLEAPVVIGRHPSADVVLENPKVSRFHARIVFEGGRWFVHDSKSLNGTYVRGVRLEPYVRVLLQSGERIRLTRGEWIVVKF